MGTALGLMEMGLAGFVHGDLKAANCLLSGDMTAVKAGEIMRPHGIRSTDKHSSNA